MTLNIVNKLRRDLQRVLDDFNKSSGIQATLKDCRYGTDATFKLHCAYVKDGNVQTKEASAYLKYIAGNKLPESALFYEFSDSKSKYKIIGYSTRAKKYPIIYKKDGKSYKCTIEYMANMLKKLAPELSFQG